MFCCLNGVLFSSPKLNILFRCGSWSLYASDAGGGVCERRQRGSGCFAGRPGKSQQQQGESESAVPVAHQPDPCQDLLQVPTLTDSEFHTDPK